MFNGSSRFFIVSLWSHGSQSLLKMKMSSDEMNTAREPLFDFLALHKDSS